MQLTDEELMLRAKEGDRSAFETIATRHYANILNFIYRFMRDHHIAEELCQETFLRLWRSAPGYMPLAKFTTFLYHIAKNVCLKELARSNRGPRIYSLDEPLFEEHQGHYTLAEEVEDTTDTPEEGALRHEVQKRIQDAVSALSEAHRMVFVLTEYQGLSYQEVAEIVQCPVGTVASRKNTAVRQLRKMLSSQR